MTLYMDKNTLTPVHPVHTPPYRVLAIETSCDETAFSIVESAKPSDFVIVTHQVHSQAELHAEFGGVFPNLAKREHANNFTPLLAQTFAEAYQIFPREALSQNLSEEKTETIKKLLSREHDLADHLIQYLQSLAPEDFDTIKQSLTAFAVTYGPGLEPALWVGISGAKALALIFDLPLYPINHMEGHIASVLTAPSTEQVQKNIEITFPALALLISGGHTEFVAINSWHEYALIGQTLDDAVGEAYDKVARILGLPYPGGPQISKLAKTYRDAVTAGEITEANPFSLPRPMLHSADFNFSFSGLKTAALYASQKIELTDANKLAMAAEFEQAVADTLISKTKKALAHIQAESLIIGGGVIANTYLRENFRTLADELGIELYIPETLLATDNASMIGLVALLQMHDKKKGLAPNLADDSFATLQAEGNLSFPKI